MNNVSFSEALQRVVNTFLFENFNTAIPAIVEKQDGPYRVVVTPAINHKYPDGTILNHNPIANVPLVMSRTKNAVIRLPKLQSGDGVLLIFSQKALDTWLSSDNTKQVSADDPRRFDLTDAIAIPGLFPFDIETPSPVDEESLEIIHNGAIISIDKNDKITMSNSDCTIEIDSNKVSINGENLTVDK